MTELMKAIMESSYRLPNETGSEAKLSTFRKVLSDQFSEAENVLLDRMGDLENDALSDADENGFMQGLLTGIELVCSLRLIA